MEPTEQTENPATQSIDPVPDTAPAPVAIHVGASVDTPAGAPVGTTAPPNAMSNVRFRDFKLPESLLRAFDDLGFEYCTPIQAQSIPITLQGHDITGKAQTGTGKTAAFLTAIITDLLNNPLDEERYVGEPRALIIAPTRELVMQIAKDAKLLCKYTGLKIITLVGGMDYQKQLQDLERGVVDIVVATPGRLIDFIGQKAIWLGMVEMLVLDEADRMLDMGFIPQVRQIIAQTPRKECRQTMLFSATFTDDILTLADRWALDPVKVEVASVRQTTDNVKQVVYLVTADQKYPLLYNLIQTDEGERVIVFTNRRDQARKLADKVRKGKGFDLEDFKQQVAQMRKMGGMSAMLDKLPAQLAQAAQSSQVDERQIGRLEGIINSMTHGERSRPEIIKASRKRRIAAGAGVTVQEVNRLLNQFEQMQKMMKQMQNGGLAKLMRGFKGMMPGMR